MIKQFVRKGINPKGRHARRIGWGLVFGIIVATLAGSWYLLQLKKPPTENEFTSSENNSALPRTLAPDFSLIDLEGTIFQLSDFRGRLVVIDFMATWCGACRAAMPQYGMIWERYVNTIIMISIDVDPFETDETLRSFADEYPYATWIWARDTANLGQTYQITAIPSTVIIDQEGYIRFTYMGIVDATTLSHEIEHLLRAS